MPFESNYEDMLKQVQQYHTNNARVQAYAPQATPDLAKNVADTSKAYPYVDPKTVYALGSTGPADSPLSRAVAEAKINKKGGGFWSGGFGGVVSRAMRSNIRATFATIETPFQFVGAVGRDIASTGGVFGRVAAGALAGAGVGAAGGAFFGGIGALPGAVAGGLIGGVGGAMADDVKGKANNPFMQTTVGQIAGQRMKGQTPDMGSGYFPGGTVHEEMVKRQQEAASINGHAVTGGRLLADAVFAPGSHPYNALSGVIDATLIAKFDPVNMVGRDVKAAQAGHKLIVPAAERTAGERLVEAAGLTQKAGRVTEAKAAKELLQRESGLIDASARVVDTQKAIEAVKTNPDIIALTDKWKDIDDVYKIKAMSNNKIPVAIAAKIADAKDQQSVMNVVVDAINNGDVVEKRALEEGKGILSTVRAAKSNAKLFALMPRGAIDFTDLENAPGKLERGWDDFDNVMKNGGADLDTRSKYLNQLARATNSRDANRVVQDYLLTDMQGKLKDLLIKPDMNVEKIKKTQGVIDKLLGSHAQDRDFMLKQLHDEIGSDAVVDNVVMNGRLYPVAKAHTVSELFEEAVDIPDPRDLRRATHGNDAMRALMMSSAWDWSVGVGDHFMSTLWRPLVLLRPAFAVRVLGEETARMLAADMDAPLMHPFSLIAKMVSGGGKAIEAAGTSGDAHAMDDAFKTSMLTMNSINHDAGIMSKHLENYIPHTDEGAQAWAGHLLNLHKDELSRHIVENGVESAKEYWWSGGGRASRESWAAKTGRELKKEVSDADVDRQAKWIEQMTNNDPRLLHAVSAGFIPTEAQMTKGPTGAKWISEAPDMAPEHQELVKSMTEQMDALETQMAARVPSARETKAEIKEYYDLMQRRNALATSIEDLHAQAPKKMGHWDSAPDQPVYFHGTKKAGEFREIEHESELLVGPGFYTTESPDIASQYAAPQWQTAAGATHTRVQNMRESLADIEQDLSKEIDARAELKQRGFNDDHAEILDKDVAIEDLKAQVGAMKGAIVEEESLTPAVHRMSWKDRENPPNLVDLEKPLPKTIRAMYIGALEDAIKVRKAAPLAESVIVHPLTDMEVTLEHLKSLPNETKGFEIVTDVMPMLSPTDRAALISQLGDLKVDGLKHLGGIHGGEKHNVSVFFDPFKLGPAEFKIPHKSVFQPQEGMSGIPLMRTDGRGLIHPDAASHMKGLALDPEFKSPKMVSGAKPLTTEAKTRWKRGTDFFFENIMAKPTNNWVRHSAFNQAYWQKIEQVMPLLSEEAKTAVLESMKNPKVQLSSRMQLRIRDAAERTTGGTIGLEKATVDAAEVAPTDIKHLKPTDDMIAKAKEAKIKAETELESSPYFDPFGPDGYAPIKAQGKEAYEKSLQEQLQAQHVAVETAAGRMGIKLTTNSGHFLGDGMNHIDQLAKGHAVKFIQDTFEGLSDRNAIEEATRLIAPFGHAWRQAGQKWVKVLAEDPSGIRKAQKVLTAGGMEGGEDDGAGFFYKNDNGEWVFNYPATGLINKIVTGNPAPLQAKVSGLSMMSQSILPGAGPFVSIAASKFIPNTPKWDGVKHFLAPYGDPTSRGVANSVLPPWMMRAKQAFDSPKMAGAQANTTMDMAKYLVSTGKYSTNTEEETNKLMEAAGHRATALTLIQTLGQFFLPSTPTPTPMAQDKNGDTVVAQLLMEDLHGDPDKGIKPMTTEQFMDKYGDRAILFIQSNSRPTTPGLTETDKGDVFLRDNPDIVKALPLTAGLFAPPGGKFDLNAYHRAIVMGNRQQLTPKQMIELAHDKYASMIYYNVSDAIGPNPSKAQSASLSVLKKGLMEKYPGFNTVVGGLVEKAKTPQVIAELEKAVKIPKVQNSDIGKALSEYLEVRTALNEIAKTRGVAGFQKSKNTADLRVIARAQAQSLWEKTPAFAIMFDRVLNNELADEEE